MTISIWRFSHLALALVSSIFLILACVTGIILAVEPIQHQNKGYEIENLEEVSLVSTIEILDENYDEIFTLEVEPSGFVKASVLTADFETRDVYVNPRTGEELGAVEKRSEIYKFSTNLHRSLFLKSIGRIFVGLVSFLLVLIAVTGFFLLFKRQGGLKGLFAKVQKDRFTMRYHVILSRWFFIPIIIVAATGVFLSVEKFDLLPDSSLVHVQNNPALENTESGKSKMLSPFEEIFLDDVRMVEFPFSDDPSEYYQVALQDKEIRVNAQSGIVESSATYPFVMVSFRLSMILHTGQGSILWSIVLLLTSLSLLFFMYSGFAMALRRRKKVIQQGVLSDRDKAEFVILVGSETGTTRDFAARFCNALIAAGKTVFMTEMNDYSAFAKAEHLIIFTATYGDGEAPTNARKFEAAILAQKSMEAIKYSVVGFGSLEYPEYCQYAIEVDQSLQKQERFQPVLELHKINNASQSAFQNWTREWSRTTGIDIKVKLPKAKKKKLKYQDFEVVERSPLNLDDTFLLRLKSKRRIAFSSGDLLAIQVPDSDIVREYSVARWNNEILLSIKKHDLGKCSSYLSELQQGSQVKAALQKNADFHLPKKAASALLIANGTGIAPFLGMLLENKKTDIHLFWGGRRAQSAGIYEDIFSQISKDSKKNQVQKFYSQEGTKQYVQNGLLEQKDFVLQKIKDNAVIMICGSLAMQNDVLDTLEIILKDEPDLSLDELVHKDQLKMDCY
ncbi:PepSY domain-containing protein [Nonlabens antarcticus]|uniref:PepSY domain-containing protein n=1 Tax=Nonlabens antarcticus TaxID=392714 RepID=UPI001891EC93|nr:PepSY domain-containing protein [Nonlabens antarcticus]